MMIYTILLYYISCGMKSLFAKNFHLVRTFFAFLPPQKNRKARNIFMIIHQTNNANRIVVKVGSSTLTYGTGLIHLRRFERLVKVLSDLRNAGKEIVLVSSGAVSAGAAAPRLGSSSRMRMRGKAMEGAIRPRPNPGNMLPPKKSSKRLPPSRSRPKPWSNRLWFSKPNQFFCISSPKPSAFAQSAQRWASLF